MLKEEKSKLTSVILMSVKGWHCSHSVKLGIQERTDLGERWGDDEFKIGTYR